MTGVRAELRDAFVTLAVTGTNGKTTTTGMLEAIVRASGAPSARVTTLGAWVNGECVAEGPTLEAFSSGIERAHDAGVSILALEVTSRALANGFAQLWPARVAVFTNLTRDHIDYHGDPEHYLGAKAQLFMTLPDSGAAVFNACDPSSALIDLVTKPTVRRFSFAARRERIAEECAELPLTLVAREIHVSREHTRITFESSPLADALGGELVLGVLGSVNVENALAAAVAAHAAGISAEHIQRGLASFPGVDGRFERVWKEPLVVVDYAHTPDALTRTLELARTLAGSGRVLVVFGCGGETDREKRPLMGRAAVEAADFVCVTSDNPRNEDPAKIAQAVLAGARSLLISTGKSTGEGDLEVARTTQGRDVFLLSDPDRASAIVRVIAECNLGDIVVVAGKGHERTQRIADRVLPFDDREVAREAARARFGSKGES
jgi:UDP-N-acetylmuramoyl-L-alanyl-D-glutamate--2,6-diaminopimelate ligase